MRSLFLSLSQSRRKLLIGLVTLFAFSDLTKVSQGTELNSTQLKYKPVFSHHFLISFIIFSYIFFHFIWPISEYFSFTSPSQIKKIIIIFPPYLLSTILLVPSYNQTKCYYMITLRKYIYCFN